MHALADDDFDPRCPVQTKRGAAKGLRCGLTKVEELRRLGKLKDAPSIDRRVRMTTQSILDVITHQQSSDAT